MSQVTQAEQTRLHGLLTWRIRRDSGWNKVWLLELRPGSFDLLLSTLRELPSPMYRGERLWLQRLHISQSDSILHVPGTVVLVVLG